MPKQDEWNEALLRANRARRWRNAWPYILGLLIAFAGFLVLLLAGCAPTAQEWQEVALMPPGPAKEAAVAKLEGRVVEEEAGWSWAEMGAGLLGLVVPGAGAAVGLLHKSRSAAIARARKHEEAASGLITNIDGLLELVPAEAKQAAIDFLKKKQEELGIRETVREYLAGE